MSIVTPSDPTSVYRYYDRTGLLLYVGITSRGTRRQREHNGDKEWWPFVARQEVEHYGSRREAASREKALIQEFRPPFNRTHNVDHEQLRELYMAAAQTMPDRAQPQREGATAPLDPAEAFRSVGGKIPMTQIQRGNEAVFATSAIFRSLLLSAMPSSLNDVLLLAPKKRGSLILVDTREPSPQLTFANKRGGIPLITDAHLHLKVVRHKPFIVRIHEARGRAA